MTTDGTLVFGRKISKKQCNDAGMAFTLIFVILGLYFHSYLFFKISFVSLILNMIWSGIFLYFAWFWYLLAEVLGNISSKILLSVVFLFIVCPVAMLRKLAGKDRLQLKAFKKSTSSVMVNRNHVFVKKDIEQPF